MDIKILTTKVKLQHLLERIKAKGENENLDEQQTLIEAILLISELQKQSTKHLKLVSNMRHTTQSTTKLILTKFGFGYKLNSKASNPVKAYV